MNLLANLANELASDDFMVFPLKPLSTEPALEGGRGTATADPAAIRAWWAATPNANIGIATGGVGNLVAVELIAAAAMSWWRSTGFGSGAIVRLPSEVVVHVFLAKEPIASFSPRPGVAVHGEAGWIAAPGSVLATGTVRGDLSEIPTAPFSSERDFHEDANRRMLSMIDVCNRVPELTSTGASFIDLVLRPPQLGLARSSAVLSPTHHDGSARRRYDSAGCRLARFRIQRRASGRCEP